MFLFNSCRTIDLLDWNSLINDTTKISNLLVVPNLEVTHTDTQIKCLMRTSTTSLVWTLCVSKEWSPGASVEQIHWWRGETDEEDVTENGRPSQGNLTKTYSVDAVRQMTLDFLDCLIVIGPSKVCINVTTEIMRIFAVSVSVSIWCLTWVTWPWSAINQTRFLLWRKSVSFSLSFVFAHLFLSKETLIDKLLIEMFLLENYYSINLDCTC